MVWIGCFWCLQKMVDVLTVHFVSGNLLLKAEKNLQKMNMIKSGGHPIWEMNMEITRWAPHLEYILLKQHVYFSSNPHKFYLRLSIGFLISTSWKSLYFWSWVLRSRRNYLDLVIFQKVLVTSLFCPKEFDVWFILLASSRCQMQIFLLTLDYNLRFGPSMVAQKSLGLIHQNLWEPCQYDQVVILRICCSWCPLWKHFNLWSAW